MSSRQYHSISFSDLEREIIILKSVWDMIHEMVNYEIFEKLHKTRDAELRFPSMTHQKFFNILLSDFLSLPRKKGPFSFMVSSENEADDNKNYLSLLDSICNNPQFNKKEINKIKSPLDEFKEWLNAECVIKKAWFPSIDTEMDMKVKRISFIKICGNISKHNFSRLDSDAREIKRIFLDNGIEIKIHDEFLLIPEFYEWFHSNILNYHSSAIAEFLNNIRWGIYDYLRPEFARSFRHEDIDSISYEFIFPNECKVQFAKTLYWDLMNAVRSPPFMPKFRVTRYLKMRY